MERLYAPMHRSSIQRKWIRCRKANCTKCPHGPYLYRAWRDAEGKVRTEYLGRDRPPPIPGGPDAAVGRHPYPPGSRVQFVAAHTPYWITVAGNRQIVHAENPPMVVDAVGWSRFGRSKSLYPYVTLRTAAREELVFHPYDNTFTAADPARRLDRRFPTLLIEPVGG